MCLRGLGVLGKQEGDVHCARSTSLEPDVQPVRLAVAERRREVAHCVCAQVLVLLGGVLQGVLPAGRRLPHSGARRVLDVLDGVGCGLARQDLLLFRGVLQDADEGTVQAQHYILQCRRQGHETRQVRIHTQSLLRQRYLQVLREGDVGVALRSVQGRPCQFLGDAHALEVVLAEVHVGAAVAALTPHHELCILVAHLNC